MKKLLFAAAAAGALFTAIPAYAGGVGVHVGPFGAGVGPSYEDHHWRHHDGYARDCRVVRERIETPHGVIYKTRRICD